jgi:hypothetical protein
LRLGRARFHKADGLKNFLFSLVQFRSGDQARQEYGGVGFGLGIVIDGKVYTGTDFTAGEFRSVFWTEGNRAQFSIPYEEISGIVNNPALMERFVRELSRNIAVFVNTFNLNKVFIGGDIEDVDIDFPAILRRRSTGTGCTRRQPVATCRTRRLGSAPWRTGLRACSCTDLHLDAPAHRR